MKKIEKSVEIGGRKLTLETGLLAQQATSSIKATYGETVVLATVVAAPLKVDLGYFPLSVDYQERLYAGGKIKGSRWVKREGRPSDDEILTSRLIDRSIRPLFPKEYKKEVQVIVTLLSVDSDNDPAILSAVATSAALSASSIPWMGPVSVLRVGRVDGKFVANPTDSEMEKSDIDLVVSNTPDSIVMLEAGTKEVSEKDVVSGIEFAEKESKKFFKLVEDFVKTVGAKKEEVVKTPENSDLKNKIKKEVENDLESIIEAWVKHEGGSILDETKKALNETFSEEDPQEISEVFEKILKEKVRTMVLSGKRPDGRGFDEIRPLYFEVGVLPRTHGSAIFQRGQTQVLSIVTLGAPSLEQLIESAQGEESKRYMHHYSMPPYATGEVGRVGSPNRREIGHGALAERALAPVIPDENKFPYAIRVVSEVLGSNGSSSMASTCGSTLALMDAGVPIASPVSGIAMGLVAEKDPKGKVNYKVMTDIVGVEDFMGDMDFKVTGTKDGVTAIQLDVKTLFLTSKILAEALTQANKARLSILDGMLKTIDKPRTTVSAHAPKIKVVKIPVEKIGEIIGPGGKTIKGLIAETGAQIEVEDDGTINISGIEDANVENAVNKIELMTKEVAAGEIYEGEVKRIESFGAFVEILPGRDGLVHVSDMSTDFVSDPHSVVYIGDKVQVRVKEIDNLGRINLSMLLDPAEDAKKQERRNGGNGGECGGFRPRQSGFRGRNDRRGGQRNFDRPRSSGPHFPTSRLMDVEKKY